MQIDFDFYLQGPILSSELNHLIKSAARIMAIVNTFWQKNPAFCNARFSLNSLIFICHKTLLNLMTLVLTGGFLFTSDLMFNPGVAKQAGRIFATKFLDAGADYVVTIETKGISLAVMTADAMNLPLVVMRRESKISEGSTLSINYISGFSDKIQKMSVSKKSLMPGTKAIIIDDFMRGGGSASGMAEMLEELEVEVVGIGVLIATTQPEIKRVAEYYPILYLDKPDITEKRISILPNEDLFT